MNARSQLLSASLLTTAALAQTTGVVGINNYTVNGLGSGTTSCTTLCFPNGGVTLNLNVSAPAGSLAIAVFNLCPCSTCSLSGPANTCFPPIPATACGGSNQSLDLDASCGIAAAVLLSPSTSGLSAALTIPLIAGIPCASAVLSTQAVVLDACGLGLFSAPGPFVLTQSFTLRF